MTLLALAGICKLNLTQNFLDLDLISECGEIIKGLKWTDIVSENKLKTKDTDT
jgi:hypothetical protein